MPQTRLSTIFEWLCKNQSSEDFTWKKNIVRIPKDAYIQNDLNAGSDEEAPIPKAMKFVTEVTVIATPAWDIM